MRVSFSSVCFVLWAVLVTSSPGKQAGDGTTTTATSQPAPSNDCNSRVPVFHKLTLPPPKQNETPKIGKPRELANRSKGQKGGSKSDEFKQSKADKMIINKNLQASNRDVILGWTLGVYGFLGFLAFVAWYFDILPGFGRSVESILEGQYDKKRRQAAGNEGDAIEMNNITMGTAFEDRGQDMD